MESSGLYRVLEKLTEDQRCRGGWKPGGMGGREDRWPGRATASSLEFTRVNMGEISASKRLLCPFLRPEECELQAEGGWCGFIMTPLPS